MSAQTPDSAPPLPSSGAPPPQPPTPASEPPPPQPPASQPPPPPPANPPTNSPPPILPSPPPATPSPPPVTPSPPPVTPSPPPVTPSPPPVTLSPPPATPSPPPATPPQGTPPPPSPVTPLSSPPPPSQQSPPPSPVSPSSSPPPPTPQQSPPPVTPSRSPPPPSPTPLSSPPPKNPKKTPPPSNAPPPPIAPPPPDNHSSSPPPPVSTISPTPSFPVTSSPPPPSPSTRPNSTAMVAGIVAGSAALLVALVGIFFFCCLRRRKKLRISPPSTPGKDDPFVPLTLAASPMTSGSPGAGSRYSTPEYPSVPPLASIALGFKKSTFTYEELVEATNGFSDANLLGKGGFGYVYRGMLDGKQVAIKQLKSGGGQGDREFRTEVETISRIHHRHLVSLVGYCITSGQRILIYEYVPNKTLEFHLHEKDRPTLDWQTRFRIALGAAKGLAYLHEDCHPKIIHRDIKAANILLDFNFEAKVSDFGLAKLQSENNTHISTRVVGTFGYLAPEYANSGRLTNKSDVYSFGVVILELITGRRPVNSNDYPGEETLVGWARPLLKVAAEEGNYSSLIDPKLANHYDSYEMTRLLACGAACVRHSAQRRPRMNHIVRYLEGDISLEALNAGLIPGYSAIPSQDSVEQMQRLRRMAFAYEDYTSNEDSAPTSAHTRNLSALSSEGESGEVEITSFKNGSQVTASSQ